jgi:hypothetical protein
MAVSVHNKVFWILTLFPFGGNLMFGRNILPPSSGSESRPSKKAEVGI